MPCAPALRQDSPPHSAARSPASPWCSRKSRAERTRTNLAGRALLGGSSGGQHTSIPCTGGHGLLADRRRLDDELAGPLAISPVVASRAAGAASLLFQWSTLALRARAKKSPLSMPVKLAMGTLCGGIVALSALFPDPVTSAHLALARRPARRAHKSHHLANRRHPSHRAKSCRDGARYGPGGCGGIFAPVIFFGAMSGACSSTGCLAPAAWPVCADQTVMALGRRMTACLRRSQCALPSLRSSSVDGNDLANPRCPRLMVAAVISVFMNRTVFLGNFYDDALRQDGIVVHRMKRILITGCSRGIGASPGGGISSPTAGEVCATAAASTNFRAEQRPQRIALDVCDDDRCRCRQGSSRLGQPRRPRQQRRRIPGKETRASGDRSRSGSARRSTAMLLASARITSAFLPLLAEHAPGARVINISSGAGSISEKEDNLYYPYSVSKAALNMLTRALAAEFRDLIVTALSSGWVQTEMGGSNAPLDSAGFRPLLFRTITGLQTEQKRKISRPRRRDLTRGDSHPALSLHFQHGGGKPAWAEARCSAPRAREPAFASCSSASHGPANADETKVCRTALELVRGARRLDSIGRLKVGLQSGERPGNLRDEFVIDLDELLREAIGDHVELFPINQPRSYLQQNQSKRPGESKKPRRIPAGPDAGESGQKRRPDGKSVVIIGAGAAGTVRRRPPAKCRGAVPVHWKRLEPWADESAPWKAFQTLKSLPEHAATVPEASGQWNWHPATAQVSAALAAPAPMILQVETLWRVSRPAGKSAARYAGPPSSLMTQDQLDGRRRRFTEGGKFVARFPGCCCRGPSGRRCRPDGAAPAPRRLVARISGLEVLQVQAWLPRPCAETSTRRVVATRMLVTPASRSGAPASRPRACRVPSGERLRSPDPSAPGAVPEHGARRWGRARNGRCLRASLMNPAPKRVTRTVFRSGACSHCAVSHGGRFGRLVSTSPGNTAALLVSAVSVNRRLPGGGDAVVIANVEGSTPLANRGARHARG